MNNLTNQKIPSFYQQLRQNIASLNAISIPTTAQKANVETITFISNPPNIHSKACIRGSGLDLKIGDLIVLTIIQKEELNHLTIIQRNTNVSDMFIAEISVMTKY